MRGPLGLSCGFDVVYLTTGQAGNEADEAAPVLARNNSNGARCQLIHNTDAINTNAREEVALVMLETRKG